MEIEREQTIGHIRVGTAKAFGRNDLLTIKSWERGIVQKDACQDVTSTKTKEDPIALQPSPLRICLQVLLGTKHRTEHTTISGGVTRDRQCRDLHECEPSGVIKLLRDIRIAPA